MSAEVIAGMLRIASQDLDGARLLNQAGNRNAAYLCEQAAEKVIRAEDREADLQMHILVSAALASTARSRFKAHSEPAGGAAHRAGSTGRRRRLRKAR